ncbi:MAG: cytochrome c biogenesis protein [Chloroflexi bacterium AL-W]|nr:cytochrome c biogenesis protein [Chloroflexi bacterium AL-N1]NOK65776.1 cytochrome c biogenesis protein [Chloroflexi bacterium AL-N10]NOK74283.1 cytochrome c biogenesis protein [Chloroflexi bacterium AL-N5]NOK80809.1 cytochrome c biogenesis protein [Chloroflexi bacterium AL-W]NOK88541.1 cytochrome c biogenesis protein [Chloroflexi bacterium AL-N15]
MYLLGTVLIVSSIATALLATIGYALATRGNGTALTLGRLGTRLNFGFVLLIVLLLAYLFIAQRYDVQYVYNYSSQELEFGYRVAAMWAGQPGSFVVWVLWGVIAAQLLIRRTRHAEPYVLSVFMLLHVTLLVFMLVRNPFVPHLDANGVPFMPADGQGLNPTLHNPWMIIHPPILFVGYALLAIPFAFAIAGLWRRDYDGWIHGAIPWALAGWAFLSLALLLGGYWAYETLGWGGYWGWDPVENAALVPWLIGTALLHSMLVQRTHGGLRRSNFVLAIVTYVLVFYATFLTRTGVLSSFSVHSFVEEGLKHLMTGFLAFLAIGSLAFLAVRWRDIPHARSLSEKVLSRDSFFILMIVGLLVIATVIGLGTSMPVISAIPGVGHALQNFFGAAFELDDGTRYNANTTPFTDGRFGLVESFYSMMVPPLALILVLLLTIGPLLGWRDTSFRHVFRALRWPAIVTVLVTCGTVLLGVRELLPLAYVSFGTFAAGTNLVMIIRTLKSGWLRIGGYLAHAGLMILLVGVVGSTAYASPDQTLVIPEGETLSAYGYDFTFNGWRLRPDNTGVLDLSVGHGGQTFHMMPQLYENQMMDATMATPSIHSELFRDVYVTPTDYKPPVDNNMASFFVNETQAIGPYEITFLEFDAAEAHGGIGGLPDSTTGNAGVGEGDSMRALLGAKLLVRYNGQEMEMTPKIQLAAGESDRSQTVQNMPVTFPGGHEISFMTFDPVRRLAVIRVEGLDLPTAPSTAVVTVSIKPAIMLVWSGMIIGVVGGIIASIRRTLEGQATLDGKRNPLGRGWGRIPRLFGPKKRTQGGLSQGAPSLHIQDHQATE